MMPLGKYGLEHDVRPAPAYSKVRLGAVGGVILLALILAVSGYYKVRNGSEALQEVREELHERSQPPEAPRPPSGPRASVPEVKPLPPQQERLLQRIAAFEGADELLQARALLQQALKRDDMREVRATLEHKLGGINLALLMGARAMPGKVRHTIVAGDLVGKIAGRYGNTQAYLLKVNNITRPELLRIGQELWVLDNPSFELLYSLQHNVLTLTLNGEFCKKYQANALHAAQDIPAGTYKLSERVATRLGLSDGDLAELRLLALPGAALKIID